MTKNLYTLIFTFLIFLSCKKELEGDISSKILIDKLQNTVWVGDLNYQGCDCGFSRVIAFKDTVIYELSEGPQNIPSSCSIYNFRYRDNGKIENFISSKSEINFEIVSGNWKEKIRVEQISDKIKISSTWTNGYLYSAEYILSNYQLTNYCK